MALASCGVSSWCGHSVELLALRAADIRESSVARMSKNKAESDGVTPKYSVRCFRCNHRTFHIRMYYVGAQLHSLCDTCYVKMNRRKMRGQRFGKPLYGQMELPE